MVKNFILLSLLTWVSLTYAKHPVAQESMGDAENFKWESRPQEPELKRTVAGGKTKKKLKGQEELPKEQPASVPDSEVRYWQYSED